ncbi:hypothetical protein H6H03_32505 [Nostoc paludosum FACHB-159]|uniref:Uncharacterized protein n=2 Tax=Nostoc TaxID=1177 RepID=A0ABR8KKA1_9NOSO|nr:hypothetical protein [Nostoc paludosum FACHB-159]
MIKIQNLQASEQLLQELDDFQAYKILGGQNNLPGIEIERSTTGGIMVNPGVSELGRLLPSQDTVIDHVVRPGGAALIGGLTTPDNPLRGGLGAAAGICLGCHPKTKPQQN